MQFLLCAVDRGAAVNVRRGSDFLRDLRQPDTFAKHRFLDRRAIPELSPGELGRKRGGIDKTQFYGRLSWGRAHRTLSTTKVRSSASGAPCANHSTSRNTWSASSAAVSSCWSSIILRRRSVPKNCPS